MKKIICYSEIAFILGLLLLALGTALMAYGDFGISMIATPGYLIHLKLSPYSPFFSFGTIGYLVEALLLLAMMLIIRKGKLIYLLSFLTAVLYGCLLDVFSLLTALLPQDSIPLRIPIYISGMTLCSAAISLMLFSYFPPAAHEMFVKEVSAHKHIPFANLKTIYDCTALLLSLILSILFFNSLQGIGIGTIICAFINGFMIRSFTKLWERLLIFRDAFPLRSYFEESE